MYIISYSVCIVDCYMNIESDSSYRSLDLDIDSGI